MLNAPLFLRFETIIRFHIFRHAGAAKEELFRARDIINFSSGNRDWDVQGIKIAEMGEDKNVGGGGKMSF